MMTGLVRKTALLAAGGLLAASAVMAGVPSPATSSYPTGVVLVGTTGGVADPLGEFTVTVKDGSGNVLGGVAVTLDANNCTPDIRICATQPHPGLTVDCSPAVGEVTGITDAFGVVTFRVVGAANNLAGGAPAAPFDCGRLFADGTQLSAVNLATVDQQGLGGVNAADISPVVVDIFQGGSKSRSDINNTNSVNASDISSLLVFLFGGGSVASCGAFCN